MLQSAWNLTDIKQYKIKCESGEIKVIIQKKKSNISIEDGHFYLNK